MEYEADAYAIKYLSSTDYHPLGLADFFIKMEGLPRPPTFLSTHPSPEDRIDKINEAWVANGSKVGDYFETRYQSFKATLP
jgi:beta-barrel assembly-enhancing protease